MAVNSERTREDYTLNGIATVYDYRFKVFAATDLEVKKLSLAGIESTLVLNTDYTVTGAGTEDGGTVVLTSVGTSGEHLTIRRNLPLTQPTSYRNQSAFNPERHEDSYDRAVMQIQQQTEEASRAILLPATFTGVNELSTLEEGYVIGIVGGNVTLLPNAAASQLADLANTALAAKGAGLIGFTDGLGYGASTVGKALEDLIDADTAMDARVDAIEGYAAQNYRSVPVRQTVHSGPLDAAGCPSFLPATSANLNLASQNVTTSAPFCVTGAAGFDVMLGQINTFGRSTANLTWTGLTASRAAATPNYLYVTVNADGTLTTGHTILAPVYQWAGTPSVTANQHTFNTSEMKMYVGNGSAATVVNRVFVGEAATDGTGVISTIAYAYNGFWTDANQAYPGTSSVLTRSHNVGAPVMDFSRLICTTTDRGYAVGDEMPPAGVMDTGGVNAVLSTSHNIKTISFSHSATTPYIRPFAGGAAATMTTANWRVQGRVKRVF